VCSFTSGNFEVFRKQAVAPSLEPRTGKAISSSGEFWQRESEDTEKKNLRPHGETRVIPLSVSV
jgi:hypothetical protein